MNTLKAISKSCLKFASLLVAATTGLQGETVTVLQESFETDGLNTRYYAIGHGDNGGTDFFARRQEYSAGTDASGGVIDGTWMWGASDIDNINKDLPSDLYPDLGKRDGVLIFDDIPVSGLGNLKLVMAVAQGQGTFEPDNHFRIQIRFNDVDPGNPLFGSQEWITIGGFRSPSTNTPGRYFEGPLRLTKDDEPRLVSEFQDWSWNLWGFGETMDLRIITNSNWRDEDYYIDNIRLIGDNAVIRVKASIQNYDLTEPTHSEPLDVTFTASQPAGAGGLVFNVTPDEWLPKTLPMPETVTIPEGQHSVTLPLTHQADGRFSGLKVVEAKFSSEMVSREVLRFKVENTTPKPNVLIMEVQNVIPGTIPSDPEGDANGDGISSSPGDQIVELVNFENYDVDISGWRVHDDLGPRHEYPEGTIIPAGRALVTFGGGNPSGVFGGAQVLTASSGSNGFAFNQTRAEICGLFAPFGGEMEIVDLPFEAQILERTLALPQGNYAYGETCSIHRLGDTRDHGFELHAFIPEANSTLFSPGTRANGDPYFTPSNVVTLDVQADAASENAETVTASVVLETPAPAGGLILNIKSNATDDEVTLSSDQIVIPAGQISGSFHLTTINDGILDGPVPVRVFVEGTEGSDVLGGLDIITITDIEENIFQVEISEFLISLSGTGEDPNMNGKVEEEIADQFIEVANYSGFPVDISDWSILVRVSNDYATKKLAHTFPAETVLNDNACAVIFGEIGSEFFEDPVFAGALVDDSSNDDSNGGLHADAGQAAYVDILNQYGFIISSIEIPSSLTGQGMSVVNVNGTAKLHLDVSDGELIFSPGKQTDGNPFPGNN